MYGRAKQPDVVKRLLRETLINKFGKESPKSDFGATATAWQLYKSLNWLTVV